MSTETTEVSYRCDPQRIRSNASAWTVLVVFLAFLDLAAILIFFRDLSLGEPAAPAALVLALTFLVTLPMIVFALRRASILRRAAMEESSTVLTLSAEGLRLDHPTAPVSASWRDLLSPEESGALLRKRDRDASLLIAERASGPPRRSTRRAMRRAHRLGVLAPYRIDGLTLIPARFLSTGAAGPPLKAAARLWTSANADKT